MEGVSGWALVVCEASYPRVLPYLRRVGEGEKGEGKGKRA